MGQRKRSSSSITKQTRDKKSLTESIKLENDKNLLGKIILAPIKNGQSKINIQDELVLVFFTSMLHLIVKECVPLSDKLPSPCRCKQEPKHSTSDDFKTTEIEDAEVDASKVLLKRNSKEIKHSRRRSSRSSTKQGSLKQNAEESRPKRNSKDSSKSDSKKSQDSTASNESSVRHFDWILQIPDEVVRIVFRNDNRYEGPISRKLMHGIGKFFWANGTIYEGNFDRGNATGQGMLQYSDLTVYTGEFCKSLLHGQGVMSISSTSMFYSGRWKAGKKNGHGWLMYETDNWYEGEWYEDQKHGVGLRQYKNGEQYKGEWYQNKQHGQGTFLWTNNDIYKGEWKNGMMNGYGEYTWNAFLSNTFTFPVENTYQGSWCNGKRNGLGIMHFGTQNGAKLVGVWHEDQKHGAGIVVCDNGQIIQRNPLFWCDKPIHLEIESGNGYPKTLFENNTCLFIAKQDQTKINNKILELPVSIDSSDFLTNVCLRSPLQIPIRLPPEETDFSYFVQLAVEKYTVELYKLEICNDMGLVDKTGGGGGVGAKTNSHLSSLIKYSKWNLSKVHENSINSETLIDLSSSEIQSKASSYRCNQTQIEVKHLRDAITIHLQNLQKLYHKYATVATTEILDHKVILIRYFLWQMFRDFNILSNEHNLIDIDLILTENSGCGLEMDHYPFEMIYFWQFLQILVSLAWNLHSASEVTENCKRCGVLATIFTNFLQDVVYKNVQITFGHSLFQYRDLLPVNGTYLLYRNLGEPHTARHLLNAICCHTEEMSTNATTSTEDMGINVVLFGENVYMPDELPAKSTKNKLHAKLSTLNCLGPKIVAQCISSVCPQILNEDRLINMEYPLAFIEFYDILLTCSFAAVDLYKIKEKQIISQELRLTEELTATERNSNEKLKVKNKKTPKK